jgi:hypothetical protein
MDPVTVIPWRTVSKIGSWTKLSAGRATKTNVLLARSGREAKGLDGLDGILSGSVHRVFGP